MSAGFPFKSSSFSRPLQLRPFPCGGPTERRSRSTAHGRSRIRKKQRRSPSLGTTKFRCRDSRISAEPAFPHVDQFDSRMLIQNKVSQGKLPNSAIVYNSGVSRQDRNWFWYRRTFEVSDTKECGYSAHQQSAVRGSSLAQRR